jgi:hypothetical protein
MQNNTTFTREQAAQFDSLLAETVKVVGTGRGLAAVRESFAEFVGNDTGALAWFDWEHGVTRRRYQHATLSNGTVIAEPVSG